MGKIKSKLTRPSGSWNCGWAWQNVDNVLTAVAIGDTGQLTVVCPHSAELAFTTSPERIIR